MIGFTGLPGRIIDKIRIYKGCWLWTGYIHSEGYGQAWDSVERRKKQAHRLVYELLVGPIPDGAVLDHLCRIRYCVNPEHMQPCTQRENLFADGSQARAKERAERDVCPAGHALVGANLKPRKDGARRCRECANATYRRSYRKAIAQRESS